VPDAGTPAPAGSGVFGYNPEMVLVTESGIPPASATTHARIYADLSDGHGTGLAIANLSAAASNITIKAFQEDGVTAAGSRRGPIPLPPGGYTAAFVSEFVSDLPEGFKGVLDIRSTEPFAALALRSLVNERNEFLMTAFPVADANEAAPSPLVFPHIADGGGYQTEFILLSPGGEASTALRVYDEEGMPMNIF